MADAIGLLVECRDEPGVLHRITEVILRHNANIGYVAGGGRGGPVAEIQLEVSGAFDQSLLTSELEAVPGAADVVVSDPVEAGVMAVMLIADTAKFSIEHVRGRRF